MRVQQPSCAPLFAAQLDACYSQLDVRSLTGIAKRIGRVCERAGQGRRRVWNDGERRRRRRWTEIRFAVRLAGSSGHQERRCFGSFSTRVSG